MNEDCGNALVHLLCQDIRRRHYKLAIRHFLMLMALEMEVPTELRSYCNELIDRCEPDRLQRIGAQVQQWAQMVADGFRCRALLGPDKGAATYPGSEFDDS